MKKLSDLKWRINVVFHIMKYSLLLSKFQYIISCTKELADEINEYLSDVLGYCHTGFIFEIHVKNIKWDKS